MPSLHEIVLLAAFLSPAFAVVAINVFLALQGEFTTLLIPRPMRFDSIVIAEEPVAATPVAAKPVAIRTFRAEEFEPLRAAA